MALGFVPSKIHQGHMQGWDYVPAVAGTYHVGEALAWGSSSNVNNLVACGATTRPVYISMLDGAIATKGDLIPCIKVDPEALYDVPITATLASVNLGDKVTLHSDSMQITATTTNGKVEIVDKNGAGTAAGDIVTVRIPV